jgi:hypothetical protein
MLNDELDDPTETESLKSDNTDENSSTVMSSIILIQVGQAFLF